MSLLSDEDLTFCKKARFKNEIADYLGISYKTLNFWIKELNIKQRGKLFTPKEVKLIIEELK